MKSRISIHDAQIANASIPLIPPRGRQGAGSQDGELGGFVPIAWKISEPKFIERNAERRERRRGFLSREVRTREDRKRRSSTEDFEGEAPEYERYRDGTSRSGDAAQDSFDLSEFSAYSNFKGSVGGKRRELVPDSSNTFGFGKGATGGEPRALPVEGRGGSGRGGERRDIGGFVNYEKRAANSEDSAASAVSGGGARGGARSHDRANPVISAGGDEAYGRKPSSPSDWSAGQDNADGSLSEEFDPYNPAVSNFPGLEEARTAAHLNDANIVTVYDCVVEGNMAYVIMEYVEGKTLAQILREIGNNITLDMICAVFKSVSHALEVAHKANVLHLDIKPENVIVNNEGVVKVTDFGLSTLMDASGQGVAGGGTIGYMPLEQMRQQRLDVRSDEWALASLTYEMLSGKNPFKARNLKDAEAAIENAELVIPSLCWENISETVDDVMFDALCPDMDGRYATIKKFSDDLTPCLGNAKDGQAQLVEVVKGGESARREQAEEPALPAIPFIDRLGARGSNIVMRVFSGLGAIVLASVALMNIRFSTFEGADTVFGLFSIIPPFAWALLLAIVAVSVIWPRFGMAASYLAFSVMLLFNQAWLPGLLLLAGTGVWWWFFGRDNNLMCSLAMLQPLFGSVGFAPAADVLAGALLDVHDAIATIAMTALSAIVFASLGSYDVMNWQIYSNYIVAVNPSIAGASISSGLVEAVSQPQNWIMIASWFAAGGLYSLFCRKGTHAFDVLASIVCAALIIAGAIVFPLITADLAILTPLVLGGSIASALFGIALAMLNVPDRVRLAPGEW